MISLLLPTRNRPESLRRLAKSVRETVTHPDQVEFCIYIDNDDKLSPPVAKELGMKVIVGPRITMSKMWNEAMTIAIGDILMYCADDLIFKSPGWDVEVEKAFAAIPDRIALVYGMDGYHNQKLATHGFLHRNWVKAVGYFFPPYFCSDFNDMWIHEVSKEINRQVYLPNVLHEHMHYTYGKAEFDKTHQERIERQLRDRPQMVYGKTHDKRMADAEKLKGFIGDFK